jgi:hypothetical protein
MREIMIQNPRAIAKKRGIHREEGKGRGKR